MFLFWEATELVKEQHDNLTLLMIDFEKAYDRVDWDFLQGRLQALGFSEAWIKGIEATYKPANSKLIFSDRIGTPFRISRSVRQGCPLAPFLYLSFAGSFSAYINSNSSSIGSLHIPPDRKLLDSEFAYDTILYLKGEHLSLDNVQVAIKQFCIASGAQMNRHESTGFWISKLPLPQWIPEPGFQWIPRRQAVRYLGVQLGIDFPMVEMVRPLLHPIKRKSLMWSAVNLSLVGWVIIVNQVLLATMWYVASPWLFSRSIMSQIPSLSRIFLWSNKYA